MTQKPIQERRTRKISTTAITSWMKKALHI